MGPRELITWRHQLDGWLRFRTFTTCIVWIKRAGSRKSPTLDSKLHDAFRELTLSFERFAKPKQSSWAVKLYHQVVIPEHFGGKTFHRASVTGYSLLSYAFIRLSADPQVFHGHLSKYALLYSAIIPGVKTRFRGAETTYFTYLCFFICILTVLVTVLHRHEFSDPITQLA